MQAVKVKCSLSIQFKEVSETSKSFETFLIEAMGEGWFNSMIVKWLQIKGNEFAERLGCPELYSPGAVYIMKPEED